MPEKVGRVIIAGIPVMVRTGFRLGIAYLKFKMKARRAAGVFERELLDGGVDPGQARELTDMYLESSQMVQLAMKGAMSRGPAARR